jgi:hypothetical protein
MLKVFYPMNKDIYLALTQLTIVIHFLFILFVVFGGFIGRRKIWLKVIHLTSLVWAVFAELSPGVVCPLTTLENYFGYHAGLSTYEEDFVARYLVPIIYQEKLTSNVQFIIVAAVIGINILAYVTWFRRGRQ